MSHARRPSNILAACLLVLAAACGARADTVRLNGVDLYYEVHGAGEPLLLIHGGLGHGALWSRQIPAFAEHFQVIVPDSRGHGRSSFDDTPIGYALMARDVVALLDHLGVEAAHLVGWSDGGIIGLEMAIHHPTRLRRLVAYGANHNTQGVRSDIGDNARFNAFIEQATRDYQRLSPAPERWQAFLDNISRMWANEPEYSEAELRGISAPVLVLGGLEEEAIYVEHMKATAALIPGSRLELMAGTGHFALIEKPEAFNRIVLDFLR